ncbi:Ig-like domain-containing protein [Marinifilum caeruleilacunae]|uniref:Tandem-95 repeat protein n=1 Tax=Marinifilum caeruleilacunae TaxID=2499076 RepID=A0ABX1WYA6_9BACT|nr:Ig-like domain-containing protein [Marinifilum caeruleilacunae]NOU60845.1 tandem-95 repeat protein [Marinifilum caeruleilacunae]
MKRLLQFIFHTAFVFSLLLISKKSEAQVDSLHYIPPMCSFTNSKANVDDHQLVLTTTETTAFDVTITNNDGTFVRTVSLSNSSPRKVSLNWPGRILQSQGIIGTGDLNKVLDTEGLIVSGSKKFFVSIQNKSNAQGDLLTSKGTTGLGTDFYSGHMYSTSGSYDGHNGHFIGVMATENNTNVTISNPRAHLKNQPNTFTISLNKGQSYVVGISINDLKKQTSNLNVINGTHISSNKPIAVSSGSMCASGKPGNNPGRDVGFDQLVPTDVVGDEYILIKGEGKTGGAEQNERALVIATEDNTVITYKNNTKTTTLANAGDYFFTNINDFSNTTDGNLYIDANKKVFVYQTLSGANKKQTAGLCFIPPLKCTADKEVTIAFTNKLSSLTVSPVLKLVTQKGSQIQLNGVNLANGFRKDVAGNNYWDAYNIPKSELQKAMYGGGSNWIFKITSSGALNAMLAVQSGNVGGGGFYSGFGDIPQVNQSPDIAEQGLCGDNVILTASGFTSYNWYKDGVVITGENNSTFQPNNPGRYKVTGLSPCGDSNTESFPSNEIRILPCLSVTSTNITVTEGTDLNAVFRVELSHPWLAADNVDVTFDYFTTAGTAASGQDYSPTTGTATIASGDSFVDISVPITNDILNENDEDFSLSITNVVEAVESIVSGTATIQDNDTPPTISVNDQTFNEDAGTVSLEVSLNTESGKTVTADYSISDNTATHPDDFTAATYSGTITFNPGEKDKAITISITDDNVYEPGSNEFFDLQLSNLSNATAGNTNASIFITDNDAMPSITISDASEIEGTDIVFQAVLDHPADVNITFDYQIVLSNGPGNAKQNDFINFSSFSSGTISIPAGSTSVNFPAFVTKDDNANEQTEEFVVNFSSVSNASLGNTSATGTILDNEGNPTLSISDASATEGSAIDFTVTVSPVRSTDINFEYRTSNGTAVSPTDFNGSGWTSVTLPANQSSMTISISTVQDTEEEGNENFSIEIGNPPNKVDIGISTATGTIIDDDDTPVAKNDSYTVDEDDSISDNVMTNDLGLGDAPVTVVSNTNPANGSLTINNDGSFTYTPNSNYNGADSFEYTIQDVDGDQSTATVNITVNPINDLPVAVNDSYSTPEDTQLNDDVSSNDSNLFDLPITYSVVSDVSNGTLSLNADGTFSYMPNSEYFGNDAFTYEITDGNGDAVQASVSISVIFNNDAAPVAVDDNTSTNEDTAVTIDVLANDSDIDGNQTIDKASVLIKTGPSNGSLSQNFVTGEVTYTPNNNYTGADSFTYTIKDNSGAESNIATVSINVTVDNDPPVALCKSGVTIYLDATGNYTLDPSEIDNGSNDDNDGGTVSLSVSPNTFDCSDKGTVSVTLTVTDEDLSSTTCTTDITVVDNSLPTLKSAQANINVSAEAGICGAKVNYTGPVFTDNCDGDQNGTLIAGLSSGSNFPVGITTVTFEYTDASGNGPVQSSFTVTVSDDEDPSLNNVSDRNLNPNTAGCEYLISGTTFDATATDNCGIQSLTHNYNGGGSSLDGESFPLGTTNVTWQAEDIHGNISTHIVQIVVSSNLSVSINGPAGNEVCEAEDAIFTANASNGNPAYSYKFYVNNVEQSSGVSGNTFTVNSLVNGDKVKVEVTDSLGCSIESSEITITVYPKPNPKLYHQ